MFRIRGKVIPGQKNCPYPGVPVLHLIAESEAIHRLHEDLGDQQVDLLPIHHFQRLVPCARKLDFITRRALQDVQHPAQFLLTINDDNVHATFLAYLSGRTSGGGYALMSETGSAA